MTPQPRHIDEARIVLLTSITAPSSDIIYRVARALAEAENRAAWDGWELDCDPMVRGECIREARERRAATDAIEKEKA